MIKIAFDPSKTIGGSLQFQADDLSDLNSLVMKLNGKVDPVSNFLNSSLSPTTANELSSYDGTSAKAAVLVPLLLSDLNGLITTVDLYDKTRFKSVELNLLLTRLIKQTLTGDDLTCHNRLLLNQAYRNELASSPKAEWHAWNVLAIKATADVIKQWERWKPTWDAWYANRQGDPPQFEPKFDDDVWKGFRDWLLENRFNNKCAYCETKIEGFIGDAEHFRPKGRVRSETDEASKVVEILDENNVRIQHPGYFWLAYNWKNLLPSCHLCNRYGGKKDLFPVGKQHVGVTRLTSAQVNALFEKITQSLASPDIYYLEPADLDVFEDRLLLHPYYDEPEKHLYFKSDGRCAVWQNSKKGEASKKVYDLDNSVKVRARSEAQLAGRKTYSSILAVTGDTISELAAAAQKFREDYYNGRAPYGAAVLDYLHERFENTEYDPDFLLGSRR